MGRRGDGASGALREDLRGHDHLKPPVPLFNGRERRDQEGRQTYHDGRRRGTETPDKQAEKTTTKIYNFADRVGGRGSGRDAN